MAADTPTEKAFKKAMIFQPRISRWSVLMLLASLIGIYLLLPQIKQLRGSIPVLEHTEIWWVIAALAMSALSFLVAAYTQFVAGNYIGSFQKITILQLTGAFINHFLPFNMGSSGLTARYYWTLGKPRTKAVAISIIPITVGMVTNVAAIAIVSPLTLDRAARHYFGSDLTIWLAIVVLPILITLCLIPAVRRRLAIIAHEALDSIANIKLRSQLPGLLFGSLSLTVILGTALLFSVYAAHTSISFIDAFTIFVTSAVVQNLTPTPGGIGASEAFLVFGLTSVGVDIAPALAATLIFRVVSFWAPIIPGSLALHVVGRWGMFGPQKATKSLVSEPPGALAGS